MIFDLKERPDGVLPFHLYGLQKPSMQFLFFDPPFTQASKLYTGLLNMDEAYTDR